MKYIRRVRTSSVYIGKEQPIHNTPGKGHSYLIVSDFCEDFCKSKDFINLMYLKVSTALLSSYGRGGDITIILKLLDIPYKWVEVE